MRLRPCGDVGVLAELDGVAEVLALHAALKASPPAGVVDLVPAARTLLVRIDPTQTTIEALSQALRQVEPAPRHIGPSGIVVLPTVYHGDDLEEVGVITGLGAEGVIRAHTHQLWTVAFSGFAPGFGYLVGEDERLHVPRRTDSRPCVPAGSVGLAGEFSGVYPRESPGGWQLIGRTTTQMWDLARDPPALLTPGTKVQFQEVT